MAEVKRKPKILVIKRNTDSLVKTTLEDNEFDYDIVQDIPNLIEKGSYDGVLTTLLFDENPQLSIRLLKRKASGIPIIALLDNQLGFDEASRIRRRITVIADYRSLKSALFRYIQKTDASFQRSENQKPVVLLVEDNDSIASIIREHYSKRYEIIRPSNEEEIINSFLEHTIDVAILDKILSGDVWRDRNGVQLDGIKIARRITNLSPLTRNILFTIGGAPHDIIDLEGKIHDFVDKSGKFGVLDRAIRTGMTSRDRDITQLMQNTSPQIVLITGPRGAGKSDTVKTLATLYPYVSEHITTTTRPPRGSPGTVQRQRDSSQHSFLSLNEMEARGHYIVTKVGSLEGDYYSGICLSNPKPKGSESLKGIDTDLRQGKTVIAATSQELALKIQEQYLGITTIAMLLPPPKILFQRRSNRGELDALGEEKLRTIVRANWKEYDGKRNEADYIFNLDELPKDGITYGIEYVVKALSHIVSRRSNKLLESASRLYQV